MLDWNLYLSELLWIALLIFYLWVVCETIVVVVFDNRNPVKTMAWVVVLLLLPFVGLIIYFFFGKNTHRERLISAKTISALQRKEMRAFVAQSSLDLPDKYSSLINLMLNVNKSLPFDGNGVKVYTNGYSMLQTLLHEIANAKNHIHLEYYIFEDDAVGRLIRDALIDKVQQGVEVRLIYDDVGSWKVKSAFYDSMRLNGIEVRAFMRVRFPLFTSRVNYRNHRKIAVIDGKIGIIGGMNIAERYLNGGKFETWRDTNIVIRGRGVHGLQTVFLRDWYFVDQSLISAGKYFPTLENSGSVLLQTVISEPIGRWKDIMQGFMLAISQARKYVYIQTPYFLPSEAFLLVIQTAALSGVDIRLMIPEHADTMLPYWGTLSYLEDVMEAGVKVYFYKRGFLHAKMLVCDDSFCTIGSTNMDFRSFENNFEANVFIYDIKTAQELKEIFLADQKNSSLVTLKNWKKRSVRQRHRESIVRLISPLL